ncbi:MAG: response regulator [Bacteroidetes bacterium]|nr:response regulator [Bacteroidota bacterium]MCL6100609.1 response regulator [Bacteroidota bacterium]
MTDKPSLLIVEDDLENQRYLGILLRNSYQVEVCDCASSFYIQMANKKFDLILMDISLVGPKDGLQLTRELKTNPTFKTIPVVALSAHAFQKDKDNAYKAGIDLYLTKPIQKNHLLEALEKILRQKFESS